MQKEITQQMIESHFLIVRGEKELFERIKNHDKVALFHLCMMYTAQIRNCLKRGPYHWSTNYKIPEANLMYTAMQGFLDAVNEYIWKEPSDKKEDSFNYHQRINNALYKRFAGENETYKRREYSENEILWLNKLNDFLTTKEKEIVTRVNEILKQELCRKGNRLNFTTDHMLIVRVEYYIPSLDDPAHEFNAHYSFRDLLEDIPELRPLCDGENHNEPGFPLLESPYCYLVHDLLDHSHLGDKVYEINRIWIDLESIEQAGIAISEQGDARLLVYDHKKRSWE